MVNNMKLKKGSKEAKAFMAKIRAAKGSSKVGYKSDRLTTLPLATKFISKYKKAGYSRKDAIKNANLDAAFSVNGWNKGGTFIIETGESKPAKAKKVIKVERRKVVKAGTFKNFTRVGATQHKDTKSHNVNIRVLSGLSRKIAGLFDTSVINDIDQLKKEYFKLAKKYHPDAGGTNEQFQTLQNEYDKHLKTLLSGSKLSSEQQANEIELDKALRDAANALAGLAGIDIELSGKWLWVTGNTYPIRTELKAAGFLFASTKKAWFYKGTESKGRGKMSLEEIKTKYGATKIQPKDTGKKLNGTSSIGKINKTKLQAALKKAAKSLNKRII